MQQDNSSFKDMVAAREDFNKARNKAFFSKIMNLMNSERDKLLSFHDVKDILKPKGEFYRGLQLVPIKLIVGSEGRYRDFNKYFLPKSEFIRTRWESINRAQRNLISLPPIQLYEIGGAYFVRDGNHRVSVAKINGGEDIDAEVISLSSEIEITPSMTVNDLKKAVLDFEKKMFYEKTDYLKITGDENLDFTIPGRYDTVYSHIIVHKYFLNQKTESEIPFETALLSWYSEVYKPILNVIEEFELCRHFPDKNKNDLYVYIVKHWDFLKRKNGIYSIEDAANDFTRKYGKEKGIIYRLVSFILRCLGGNKKK